MAREITEAEARDLLTRSPIALRRTTDLSVPPSIEDADWRVEILVKDAPRDIEGLRQWALSEYGNPPPGRLRGLVGRIESAPASRVVDLIIDMLDDLADNSAAHLESDRIRAARVASKCRLKRRGM